MITEGLTI